MRALKTEIASQSRKYADYIVQTVFIGGGTPTAVEAGSLIRVLQVLRETFTIAGDAEISIEANPGTVTKDALELYRAAGINRLSIGLQSANDAELKLLGRIHTYADFLETYCLAVQAGFTNINVDLMSALPGQTVEEYEDTLRKVLALKPVPQHISAYSLIIEEGTPFYDSFGAEREEMDRTGEIKHIADKQGKPHLPSEEEERLMYERTAALLTEAGFERYEISNYSKPGFACRHNTVYWRRGDYVGFGLGAASLVDNVRFRNTDNLQKYMEAEASGTEVLNAEKTCIAERENFRIAERENFRIAEQEILSLTEQMEEFMFLGLRMTNGISGEEFRETFGVSIESVFGEVIRKNVEEGLLEEISDGKEKVQKSERRIALTGKGMDVSNYVMAQFLL